MSVEKTTVTLLKHQVLSLAQLVVYVVYEEAIASGQATSANLLLVTELSEALMCRLGNTVGSSTASGAQGLFQLNMFSNSYHSYMFTELTMQAVKNTSFIRTAQTWQFSYSKTMRYSPICTQFPYESPLLDTVLCNFRVQLHSAITRHGRQMAICTLTWLFLLQSALLGHRSHFRPCASCAGSWYLNSPE